MPQVVGPIAGRVAAEKKRAGSRIRPAGLREIARAGIADILRRGGKRTGASVVGPIAGRIAAEKKRAGSRIRSAGLREIAHAGTADVLRRGRKRARAQIVRAVARGAVTQITVRTAVCAPRLCEGANAIVTDVFIACHKAAGGHVDRTGAIRGAKIETFGRFAG